MPSLDRGWVRPAPTARQQRLDLLMGVFVAGASVVSLDLYRSAYDLELTGNDLLVFGAFALAGLLFTVRRRLPLTVLVAESVLFIVIGERQPEIGVIFTIQMILFAALYTAWAWSRHTRALLATTAAVLAGMFGWLVWQFVHDVPASGAESTGVLSAYWSQVSYSLLINVVYFFGAIAWGHVAWRSARQRAELAEQHRRERAAQVHERDRAVQAERIRIARDLHDVVAHHVSGIGVQAAGAARVLPDQVDVARHALGAIEESSRTAVAQMHQLVGLLRDEDESASGSRAPQPSLQDLPDLATNGERPVIEFRQVGEPFEVPATLQLSLVRVAQEAVANIVRHASANHGTITLRYLDGEVEIEVIDDGRGPVKEPAGEGGYGLSGIRERAAMHGGHSEIGPRPDGGFRVRVTVPA